MFEYENLLFLSSTIFAWNMHPGCLKENTATRRYRYCCSMLSKLSMPSFFESNRNCSAWKIWLAFVYTKNNYYAMRKVGVPLLKKSCFLWRNASDWKGMHFFSRNAALFDWRCLWKHRLLSIGCTSSRETCIVLK